MKHQNIITNKSEFEEAISWFQQYKPVKISRELKDEFHKSISRNFLATGIESWSATLTPQKKSWKYQRA